MFQTDYFFCLLSFIFSFLINRKLVSFHCEKKFTLILGYTMEHSPGVLKKKPARPLLPQKPLKLITPSPMFESLVTVHKEASISESEREMDELVASLGLEMAAADKKTKNPNPSVYSVTPPPFSTDQTPLLGHSSSFEIDPSFFDCSRLSDTDSPIPLADFKDCRPLDTPPPQIDESLC